MAITKNERVKTKAKASISTEGRVTREYTMQRLVEANIDYSDHQLGSLLGYQLADRHVDDSKALLLDFEIERFANIGEPLRHAANTGFDGIPQHRPCVA
jgi:hypothetical protein